MGWQHPVSRSKGAPSLQAFGADYALAFGPFVNLGFSAYEEFDIAVKVALDSDQRKTVTRVEAGWPNQ